MFSTCIYSSSESTPPEVRVYNGCILSVSPQFSMMDTHRSMFASGLVITNHVSYGASAVVSLRCVEKSFSKQTFRIG